MISQSARAAAVALALASCTTSAPAPDKAAATPSSGSPKGVELADLDQKADPCVDFDQFASGGWRAAHPIPAGQQKWSRRLAAREQNRKDLLRLLQELAARSDWPAGSPEQQVADQFASCTDEAAVEAAGLQPLSGLLGELDAAQSLSDVQRMMRRLQDLSIAAPFSLTGGLDYREPLRFVANFAAGSLGLPDRDHYSKAEPRFAEIRAKYLAHAAKLLSLSGVPAAQAAEAAGQVFALEKRLAEASLDAAAAADPAATDHKLSFSQLEQAAPDFEWAAYFHEANLPRTELNVAEPKLLQQLNWELKETPIAVWRSYLKLQLLESASPFLAKAFADEAFAFRDQVLGGATEPKPRAERCAESTEALLGDPVGRKYAERHFPPAAKAKVRALVDDLLAALKEDVAALSWMTPEWRQKALQKLGTYSPQIGYPDDWKDYSAVPIRRGALWANAAAARRFAVDDNRKQIGKPTPRALWQLRFPSTANAYLDLQLNQIVLPAGFLQPPAFDLNATDAVNLGAIGNGVAHDLTHAIDTLGADNDPEGRPINWWTEEDKRRFAERGQCVATQFEGYFIEPGVHHSGKLVLGESIGDLGGAKLALAALQQSMARGPAPLVDGLTPEQQLFLSIGQSRGEAMRIEAQRQLVKSDPHPVAKFRVNGPLSNLPEFQRAFSCKDGAPMVRPPEQRCRVW